MRRRTLDFAAEVLVLARVGEVEAVAGGVEAVEEVAHGREEAWQVRRVRRLCCDGRCGRERRCKLRLGGHRERWSAEDERSRFAKSPSPKIQLASKAQERSCRVVNGRLMQ